MVRALLFLLFVPAFCSAAPLEQTLVIIKPNAVAAGHVGSIISRFEREGFTIAGITMQKFNRQEAACFYQIHKERPFFKELIAFMTSGPIVAFALEGSEAVARTRLLIGATDPAKAAPGTLRYTYGTSLEKNALHASDSNATAKEELLLLFGEYPVTP